MTFKGQTPVLVAALALVLAACGPQEDDAAPSPESPAAAGEQTPTPDRAAAPEAPSADEQWNRYVSGFLHQYFEYNPTHAVYAGKHAYDGQLPDWSPQGLADYVQWLKAQRETLASFNERELSDTHAFQVDYLRSVVDEILFWIVEADWPRKNPMWYAGSLTPSVYATRQYAPLSERLEAYIAYAHNLPEALAQMRKNLETPLPVTYVETAHKMVAGLATYFKHTIPKIFADAINDLNRKAFKAANAAAIAAAEKTARWFAAQRKTADHDFAMGAELYKKMLWATERVDIPLDRLREIAHKDLKRNLKALHAACEAYAPETDIRGCLERVKTDKPEDGPVAAAERMLDNLRQFIVEHRIVAIPGSEHARVAKAPPYRRSNLAYIMIPGPFEQGLPSTYYIAPPDPSWTPAEQRAYIPSESQLLFITIHEVWPGHFLQFLHAQKIDGLIGQLFVGYAFAEGWAHYAEELMYDAGIRGATPEVHIGQLLNALLRDVRFISSLGLHTGGMTVEESIALFRNKAFQDPGNARQQAARGTYDPGYLNYTMGKLMIMTLRADWTASRGGRKAWNEFHNAFLSYGGPPIPLVRRAMLGKRDDGPLIDMSEIGGDAGTATNAAR